MVKKIFLIFVLTLFAGSVGCATTGGGDSASSSAGGSSSNLNDTDFKRMGINKSSYGNSY
ncbi:uncharacterized protein METZ01_LOCUS211152 [marine metagenome]|uniref:Uncharacterized protein n=1 Tax=marine metagenome TaxID=408172 RepID=A0A382F5K8_9ZZZZ